MQSPGDRPAGNASLAGVRWGCLTGRALAATGKRSTVAVTQHSERVTDFTVSMPRTPLNFPRVRQVKLLLYFTTLQVTETQLPQLLTRVRPPEFRWLQRLSELPVCSLCSAPGVSLLEPPATPSFQDRLI